MNARSGLGQGGNFDIEELPEVKHPEILRAVQQFKRKSMHYGALLKLSNSYL
jgi:hypothetical protein